MNSVYAKFWMVLGDGVPAFRHVTLESAKAEAERLARLKDGHVFVVLEAIEAVRKSDIQWTELWTDQIPF